MLMLRKALVALAAVLFGVFLYSTVLSASLRYTLQASHVKKWLSNSGIYNNLVDSALENMEKNPPKPSDTSEVPLSDPAVRKIITSALTPQFLQNSSEQVIDGTFRWLNGQVKTPDFKINISGLKTNIINGVADYARSRYNSLPICPARTLPSSTDVFQINCRPARGFNIEPSVASFKQQLTDSKDFLPNSTIDSANLSLNQQSGSSNQKPIFERLNKLPKAYQWLKIAPFILGFITLGLMAAVIFGSNSRRGGLKRVAIALIAAGLLLIIGVFITSAGLDKAEQAILTSKSQQASPVIQKDVIAIIRSAAADLSRPTLWFGILFVTAAIGAFVYLIISRNKQSSKNLSPSPTPKAS